MPLTISAIAWVCFKISAPCSDSTLLLILFSYVYVCVVLL
jgi:hypothetical protein